MVTSTGGGLSVLISADYVPHHHWMAFLCWYSISKNAPDARVAIMCHRRPQGHNLFGWTRRCGIRFSLNKLTEKQDQAEMALRNGLLDTPLLVVEPDLVMLRELAMDLSLPKAVSEKIWLINDIGAEPEKLPDGWWCEAREEIPATFASILGGWGKFVAESWINKSNPPFSIRGYAQGSMTSNETRIGELWSASAPVFQAVN